MSAELNYGELCKAWGVRLWDEAGGRVFDEYMLEGRLWRWWDAQPFRLEGLVVHRLTQKAHRLTSRPPVPGAGPQYRMYTVGPEVAVC